MLVSVSRRCDIPRFRFDWFMERLDAGFAEAANPFNAAQVRKVPLVPAGGGLDGGGVEAFIFWTRDPRNVLANAEELEKRGFPFYIMTSLTAYPDALEPNKVEAVVVIEAMRDLARKIGKERVIWRYDPVILTSITSGEFHLKNFDALAQELKGSVQQVIISIYDEYKGAKKRLEALEKAGKLSLIDANIDLSGLLTGLAKSAEAAGMEIQSCAEKEDFSPFGIKRGACIDAELLKRLFGLEFSGKDKNQRPNCLCCKSVDIGAYGDCAARCAYCYAW